SIIRIPISTTMTRFFLLPLLFVFFSSSQAELNLGETVDGLVDGLRPTVNGLLGTVDTLLPLGIRLKRDVELGKTVDGLVDGLKTPVNGLLGNLPLGIRLKRELNLGNTVDGLVDGLRPTVNGLLGTVDTILPLGITLVRRVFVTTSLDSLTSPL
ncbi:hypothetical protein PENTCL1PPCAC_3075, partial [Pristionchus entomophagus]